MIRHIVMWKFRAGTKSEQEEFLTRLAALQGEIPALLNSRIERNIGEDSNADAVLIADFADLEALKRYKEDPRHMAVSALCLSIRESRTCVDFTL